MIFGISPQLPGKLSAWFSFDVRSAVGAIGRIVAGPNDGGSADGCPARRAACGQPFGPGGIFAAHVLQIIDAVLNRAPICIP